MAFVAHPHSICLPGIMAGSTTGVGGPFNHYMPSCLWFTHTTMILAQPCEIQPSISNKRDYQIRFAKGVSNRRDMNYTSPPLSPDILTFWTINKTCSYASYARTRRISLCHKCMYIFCDIKAKNKMLSKWLDDLAILTHD